MKIQKVTDPAFRKYGQVLEGYDFTGLIKEMKHTPVPEDVIYVPSVEELEALDIMKDLQNKGYGGLPVQIGYCNGHNKKLNAVEYHRNSEINVAVTLHYAPCHVNEGGFQCVVVLPKGTNTDLTFQTEKTGEDSLMTAKNKWLIAHEDAKIAGAFNGLKGENITID